LADGDACWTFATASPTAAVVAPVDDHLRAHLRKPDGGREPDAARRTGDERRLIRQVEIHAFPL
jgi:hypothetical protein